MAEPGRIEQLRRRVQKDPASIAFAQLGEEHRRAGEYNEAVRVCRTGLDLHPGYLSARVTLGRSLLEIGRFDEAQAELEHVLRAAPDNLAASLALAEIHQRRDGKPQVAPPPHPVTAAPDFTSAFRSSDEHFAQALQTLESRPLDLRLPPREAETQPAFDARLRSRADDAQATAGRAGPNDPNTADLKVRLYAPQRAPDDAPELLPDDAPQLLPDDAPQLTLHVGAAFRRPEVTPDPALTALEAWLDAILAARGSRR